MLRITKGPYLQWPTRDSITVMWETPEDATTEMSYWETERVIAGLNGEFRTLPETGKSLSVPGAGQIHRVVVKGLKPETTYHYKTASRSSNGDIVESGEHEMKTAVDKETPFCFALTAETGGFGDDRINWRLLPQIKRYRPEFLIVVGDSVRDGRRYGDWDRYLFGPGRELFNNTPFYLCLGNHEENGEWFYKYMSFPEPKNYYSFDYGNAHFTALDSTAGEDREKRTNRIALPGDGLKQGSPQYQFLVEDLKASKAIWKIVFFHYPPYVSGDYEIREMRSLCPVFEEYGVDIVFNSHTIVYERSHPIRAGRLDLDKGVRYIIVGGAGMKQDWFNHKFAWHTAQAIAVPHFVQVAIAGESLELRAIDLEGRLFDSMTLRKN